MTLKNNAMQLEQGVNIWVIALGLIGTLAVTSTLYAQDLDRIMPAPVPSLVAPETLQKADPAEQFLRQVVGASKGEKVLLSSLAGIILLQDESALSVIRQSQGEIPTFSAPASLDTAELRDIVATFVGLPVSRESLKRLTYAIRFQLSSNGKPFSVVYTPPQDITEGWVQIVIKESKAGKIHIEGASYFSDQSYLSRIRQKSGEVIDAVKLREDIDRINRNPFRAVATRVEKGADPATTDIVFLVREQNPLRFLAGYNNNGSETTTLDRFTTGINWGNVFGSGHQLSVQLTGDLDFKHSKSISANYIVDLPWFHYMTVFGAYSQINGITDPSLNQEGESWQLGINYEIPLENIGKDYSHKLFLGLDNKSSDNNLELTLPPVIIPISNNLTRIVQARAQYQGTWQDALGSTRLSAKLTFSPGGIGSRNNDAPFELSRRFATADYYYANLDLKRDTLLTGGFEGWNWVVKGAVQLSSKNLLSSEQFSAGGSRSVRGYEENEVVGDNALLFSQELISPVFKPAGKITGSTIRDALRVYIFQDYAQTWSVDKLSDEVTFKLHSLGAGLRYQFGAYANAQISYGWQLRDSGSSDSGDNGKLHLSIQFSY